MQHSTLSRPLSVIALMLGVIVLFLAAPTEAPQAAQNQQYPYTTPATSTPTTQATSTTEPASSGGDAAAATNTLTPTTNGSRTATRTAAATNTSAPVVTPTPEPGVEGAIACLPGQTIYIEGKGPPSTALILYFDTVPVGGGTSDAAGNYRLKLVMGNERSGTYKVEVRVRGSRRVIQEVICGVQQSTPTPTRARRTSPP